MKLQFPFFRPFRLRLTLKSGAQITVLLSSYSIKVSPTGGVSNFEWTHLNKSRHIVAVEISEIVAIERLPKALPRWRGWFA